MIANKIYREDRQFFNELVSDIIRIANIRGDIDHKALAYTFQLFNMHVWLLYWKTNLKSQWLRMIGKSNKALEMTASMQLTFYLSASHLMSQLEKKISMDRMLVLEYDKIKKLFSDRMVLLNQSQN